MIAHIVCVFVYDEVVISQRGWQHKSGMIFFMSLIEQKHLIRVGNEECEKPLKPRGKNNPRSIVIKSSSKNISGQVAI